MEFVIIAGTHTFKVFANNKGELATKALYKMGKISHTKDMTQYLKLLCTRLNYAYDCNLHHEGELTEIFAVLTAHNEVEVKRYV